MIHRVVIAIDPGYAASGDGCAVALYQDRELELACYLRHDAPHAALAILDCAMGDGLAVVVERPEARGPRAIASRSSVLDLAWAGAMLAGRVAGRGHAHAIATPTPSEWKGSAPKPPHHRRLWRVLAAAEREVLGGDATEAAINRAAERGAAKRWPAGFAAYPRSWRAHNLLDAAALGAWYLGRLPR